MNTVYFATNRDPKPKKSPTGFGKNFNPDGMSALRFGKADVKGRKVKIHVAPETLVPDSTNTGMDEKKSTLGSAGLFEALRKEMLSNQRDTLIFIHGYNVTFREALIAAGRVSENLRQANNGKGVNCALFSWPSDGMMTPWLAYASDRRDAAVSGPALARVLLKFTDFLRTLPEDMRCNQKVHLMAHSMGSYVLRNALQEMLRQTNGKPPRIMDQVFLMAADEDDDAFELDHKLKLLPKMAKRVNVYFNREDRAMAISDLTKSNPDRLGDDGPRLPFQIPAKVTQIDCTPVVTGAVEHSYYLDCAPVIRDEIGVLNGQEPEEIDGRYFLDDRNRYVLEDF
jgi:esterase/lipase superfamily enzyme